MSFKHALAAAAVFANPETFDTFRRRRARRFPRAAKIKMSAYPRKRPKVERAK